MTPGRKNCLFIGAPEEERKRCKVGGLAWLTWVLGKLPGYNGDVRDLMPAAMPKAEVMSRPRGFDVPTRHLPNECLQGTW